MVSIQSKYLPDNDVKQLASLLPFISTVKTSNNPREQALIVAEAIDQLITDLELKSCLQEYKVPKNDIEGIIERALPDGKQDVRYKAFVEMLRFVY